MQAITAIKERGESEYGFEKIIESVDPLAAEGASSEPNRRGFELKGRKERRESKMSEREGMRLPAAVIG
jgi:hypothetical protein